MSDEAKNVIFILTPFEAVNILSAIEILRENKLVPTLSMAKALSAYVNQCNEFITDDQLDDFYAELEMLKLIDKHY